MRARTGRPWGRIALAAGVFAAAWWLVLADSQLWFRDILTGLKLSDFTLYYSAARIGLEHGWGSIYDLSLQKLEYERLLGDDAAFGFGWRVLYISTPPVAWIVAPLVLLPLGAASYVWFGLLVALYVAVGFWAAPPDPLARAAFVLIPAVTFPVLDALHFGQIAVPVAVAVVAAVLLLDKGRDVAAGLVLCALLLKPQVAWLVPVVVAVRLPRHVRALAALAAGTLVLAALSTVTLGSAGIADWVAALRLEQGHPENLAWTGAAVAGAAGPLATAVESLTALAVLAVAWLTRRQDPAAAVAAACAGSFVAFPYHQAADSVVLLAASWLTLRRPQPGWYQAAMSVVWGTAFMGGPWGSRPLMLASLAWLMALLARAVAGRGQDAGGSEADDGAQLASEETRTMITFPGASDQ